MRAGTVETGREPAGRLQKPSWKDPRLLIGLLLVLASMAAVVALLGSADQTTDMYAAKHRIAVGEQIAAEDLVVVPVRLGDVHDQYLAAAAGIPERAFAQRLIEPGELVARAALDDADALGRKPVGIEVTESLPGEATVGSRVDVWVSLPAEDGGFGEPEMMLEGAEISQLSAASSALGSSTSTQLHVLVDDGHMAQLLGALSNDAKLAVVWNPGGTGS